MSDAACGSGQSCPLCPPLCPKEVPAKIWSDHSASKIPHPWVDCQFSRLKVFTFSMLLLASSVKVIWGPLCIQCRPPSPPSPPLSQHATAVCARSGGEQFVFILPLIRTFCETRRELRRRRRLLVSTVLAFHCHDLSTALAAHPMAAAGTQSRRHLTARRKYEFICTAAGKGIEQRKGLSCLPATTSRFPIVYLVRARLSTGVRDTHAAAAAQHRVCFFFLPCEINTKTKI